MSSIPILGQTSASKPLNTGDLTPEQRERLAAMADENPPAEDEVGTPVTTAFIVAVGLDGAVVATADLTEKYVPRRGATPDDIYGAASVVLKDIASMETAQRTQQAMMMMGQAMQRQAEETRLRSSLKI
uniref:YbaB/EbfC family DNA-binding protein n=1 Tax=Streptomyces sp. NBC_01393 TaxID=2903851 RepID=A0AAU3I5W0_9ACTN